MSALQIEDLLDLGNQHYGDAGDQSPFIIIIFDGNKRRWIITTNALDLIGGG